ncbi:MAG TPA: hypothetical protein VHP11_12355 [Tepidisphaeraceae bacterium]|nr:hypothetical protein [Tepidisphaeraceae bacterium]
MKAVDLIVPAGHVLLDHKIRRVLAHLIPQRGELFGAGSEQRLERLAASLSHDVRLVPADMRHRLEDAGQRETLRGLACRLGLPRQQRPWHRQLQTLGQMRKPHLVGHVLHHLRLGQQKAVVFL